MKNKVIIIASWLLVLLTMIIIFNFSSQTSTQSEAVSESVIVDILGVFMEKEEITPPVVQKFQIPIRKIAHFGIYMLLGFCMLNAFYNTTSLKSRVNIALSCFSCAAYAAFDEAHQSFSEGRGPSIIDVLIDTGGAILGVFLFVLFILLCKKIVNKKSRTDA